MSRRKLRRHSSNCRENDSPTREGNCRDYRFHRTETYPSTRPMKPRCKPIQDEAITRSGNSLEADGCGRPFEMVKDDVLLAWQQSPHKDTLGFYGVGSPIHQPESVVFNRVLAACLVKVSSGGTRPGRPKKTASTRPSVSPACNTTAPQLCKSFILNRQALQSELQRMPYVRQELEPGRAFETAYCPDNSDPSDPFGVQRQTLLGTTRSRDPKHKRFPNDRSRRPWYCPVDCGETLNGCTQYEWARYKLDPRPHNKEFWDWLHQQGVKTRTEPKDYDQLYERFVKCFEQKPSPDPLCKIYEKCCKPKKVRERDDQGGGDGHRGNGYGQQLLDPGEPEEPSQDQDKPYDKDKPGTGKEREENEKGTNEGADGTGDTKDKGDGNDKNKIVEKDNHKNINEHKNKDDNKDRVVEKEKNNDINKDKDKDISKDQNVDELKNTDQNKSENKNKNKNKNKKKKENEQKEDKVNEDENFKIEKRKPEPDVPKKEVPKREVPKKETQKENISNERLTDKGRPSVKPYIPSEKNSANPSRRDTKELNTELEEPVIDYKPFVPKTPKDKVKVPHKRKKKVRNKIEDRNETKKICEPCPPSGCQCEICHFMDRRREPEAPFMRDMRRKEQKRQLRAYYRQMCHREYIQSRCREEYRAPRHNCDPICCENFLWRNPRLAEHCDCLGAVQELQKLISVDKDNRDCSRLLHQIEHLRRRLCQCMCDCILG
ncbi:uncharacterized protein LOC108033397 [Drosophila biarmipes]|uniref:uncharacterized protein LOC108033397 n=1 Tax=Drosophila biarmipes TaxID=125945 RepID=UPI0007E77309|nr:uncharacterized protein LOC108033397 [Drosophila biarmipes]